MDFKKYTEVLFFIGLISIAAKTGFSQILVDAGRDTTYCVGLASDTMYLGKNLIIENGVSPYSVKWECRYMLAPTLIFTASDFLNDTTVVSPYFKNYPTSREWLKFIVHVSDGESNFAKDSIKVRFSTFDYLTGYIVVEVEKGDSVLFSQSSIVGGIEPLTFHWQPITGLSNPDALVTWCNSDSLTQYSTQFDIVATDSCRCISEPNLAYEVRVLSTGLSELNVGRGGLNIRQTGAKVFFNNPYKQKAHVTLCSLNGGAQYTFEIADDNFEIAHLLLVKGLYIVKISVGKTTDSEKIINY